MFKNFFMGIAAMAALTLVSCSSDDLNSLSDTPSKNEAISFDSYLGRSAVSVNGSRGSALTKTALQGLTEGFGVFGNYKNAEGLEFGSNWFDNVKVTYSSTDTKWKYSPDQYWLPQGHIDFLAYAPYDSKYDTKVTKDNQKLDLQLIPLLKIKKICCGLMLRIRLRQTILLHLLSIMHWLRLVIPSKQMLSVQEVQL